MAHWEQLSYYPQVCQRVRRLAAQGRTAAAIADQLNAEGYRPPKRRERFGQAGILGLVQRLGLGKERTRTQRRDGLAPHEWGLPELARTIGMLAITHQELFHSFSLVIQIGINVKLRAAAELEVGRALLYLLIDAGFY